MVLGGKQDYRLGRVRWPRFEVADLRALEEALIDRDVPLEGPALETFERRFAEFHDASFAICVANGTVALQLAYEALDIGFGDAVIVPGLTWQAPAAAALDVNAVPILVDVEPETYCIDPLAVEAALTPRTKAIVAVHLYSSMADLDELKAIADDHGIALIEDCAHAHGSKWRGVGAGSIGRIGTFSFQHTKSLTAGEGGIVITSDPLLRERLYSLRSCGRIRSGADSWLGFPVQSGNYRLSEAQAAVLGAQLDRFGDQFARRARASAFLDARLSEIPGIRPIGRHTGVTAQGMYGYVFRYESSRFGGLSLPAFHRALNAEIEIWLKRAYEPLDDSQFYRPLSKRRHHLSEEYIAAIDPSRFKIPVARHAYENEAVVIPHEYLLEPRARLAAIPAAVQKLHRHAQALSSWERDELDIATRAGDRGERS